MNDARAASAGTVSSLRIPLLVFAWVLLARLALIIAHGSPVPFWDEWSFAPNLYLPWLEGKLSWHDLIAPHNEHRPALTRILALALFQLNHHVWPVWIQLYVNAALHATCAALLVFRFSRAPDNHTPPVYTWILALGIGSLFALPAGWQNALWGFQSQVYLGNLLSLAALIGLLLYPPLSARWWLGYLSAVLALFTQGSGVFAAAVALVFTAAYTRFFTQVGKSHRHWIALALVVVVVVLGVLLRVQHQAHDSLAAQNLGQFLAVFTRCLSWPFVNSPWLWLVLQAPLLILTVRTLRQRTRLPSLDHLAIALGLLVILHASAVAYTRAAGLPDARPLSRYQDPLLLGVAAQFYAVLRLIALAPRPARPAALLWAGVLSVGLLILTTTNLSLNLPYKRAQNQISLRAVQTYLATHDPAALVIEPVTLAPHPDPAVLRALLDDPRLRPLLPREFFAPRDLTRAAPDDTPAATPATSRPVSTPQTPASTSTSSTPTRAD